MYPFHYFTLKIFSDLIRIMYLELAAFVYLLPIAFKFFFGASKHPFVLIIIFAIYFRLKDNEKTIFYCLSYVNKIVY